MSIANTIIDAFQPIKDLFIPPDEEVPKYPSNQEIVYPKKITPYNPAALAPVPFFEKSEYSSGEVCYAINFPTQNGSFKLIQYCNIDDEYLKNLDKPKPQIDFFNPNDYPIDGWFEQLKGVNVNWLLWYYASSITWNFSNNNFLDSGNFSAQGNATLTKYSYTQGNKTFWGNEPNLSYSESENSTYNVYFLYSFTSTYSKNYQVSVRGAGIPGTPISFDSGHYRVYRVDDYSQIGTIDSPIKSLSGNITSTVNGVTTSGSIEETIAHLGQPMLLYSVSKGNLKKHISNFKKVETTTNDDGYRTTKWRLFVAPLYFGSNVEIDIDPVGDNPDSPNPSSPKGDEKEKCGCCKCK